MYMICFYLCAIALVLEILDLAISLECARSLLHLSKGALYSAAHISILLS